MHEEMIETDEKLTFFEKVIKLFLCILYIICALISFIICLPIILIYFIIELFLKLFKVEINEQIDN